MDNYCIFPTSIAMKNNCFDQTSYSHLHCKYEVEVIVSPTVIGVTIIQSVSQLRAGRPDPLLAHHT